jgi:hypothetical protein
MNVPVLSNTHHISCRPPAALRTDIASICPERDCFETLDQRHKSRQAEPEPRQLQAIPESRCTLMEMCAYFNCGSVMGRGCYHVREVLPAQLYADVSSLDFRAQRCYAAMQVPEKQVEVYSLTARGRAGYGIGIMDTPSMTSDASSRRWSRPWNSPASDFRRNDTSTLICGEPSGTTGFRPGGPKSCGSHLLSSAD